MPTRPAMRRRTAPANVASSWPSSSRWITNHTTRLWRNRHRAETLRGILRCVGATSIRRSDVHSSSCHQRGCCDLARCGRLCLAGRVRQAAEREESGDRITAVEPLGARAAGAQPRESAREPGEAKRQPYEREGEPYKRERKPGKAEGQPYRAGGGAGRTARAAPGDREAVRSTLRRAALESQRGAEEGSAPGAPAQGNADRRRRGAALLRLRPRELEGHRQASLAEGRG